MGLRKVKVMDREQVLPSESGTGAEIKAALGIRPDRSLAIRTQNGLAEIPDNKRVEIPEGAELIDIPFHEYGMDPRVGHRLEQEAVYLSQKYDQEVDIGYDRVLQRWWVHLPDFPLPYGWRQRTTPILVTVTDLYPQVAPDGFILKSNLTNRHGHAPAHYYGYNGRHDHLTSKGYGWFCLHLRGWKGDHQFDSGDSVAKYLSLIEIAVARVVS